VGVSWEILTNQMTYFICCCVLVNNGIHDFKWVVPDWKMWVTAINIFYMLRISKNTYRVVRNINQSDDNSILLEFYRWLCHSKTLVAYFRAKFQVCRDALTFRVKQYFICCCVLVNNGIHDFKWVVPDWKMWVTAIRLHYVNCSGDSWVEGVHRYLRQFVVIR
jgi:hypothetical protein